MAGNPGVLVSNPMHVSHGPQPPGTRLGTIIEICGQLLKTPKRAEILEISAL